MICIVSPRKREIAKALARCHGESVQWVYLGESIQELVSVGGWFGGQGSRILIARRLQETARSLRQSYIDYIGSLCLERHSLLWWAGELSEKNPSISKILRDVCYLTVCRELVKEEAFKHTILVGESAALRVFMSRNLLEEERRGHPTRAVPRSVFLSWGTAVFRHVAFIVRETFRIVVTRRVLKRYRSKVKTSCGHDRNRDVVLLNAWVDHRSIGPDGVYRDAYFGKAVEYLRREGKSVLTVANILATVPYRTALRKLLETPDLFLFPFFFLKVRDLFSAALRSFEARPRAESYPPFGGIDISGLIYDEALRFWRENRMCYPLLRFSLVQRWKEAGVRIASFLYPFENMRWEKVFCLALKKYYPDAVVTGYAHSSFSLMSLNHFCSEMERESMPQPDRLLVNGDAYVTILREAGFGSKEILNVGALRYEYLFSQRSVGGRIGRPADGAYPGILVTLSIDRDTALELLWKTVKALGTKEQYRVILKCHPVMPFRHLDPPPDFGKLPAHFELSETPVSVLLQKAAVLLYSDSTTSLEAVMSGVPVIQVSSDCAIDMDPLDVYPEVRRVAHTPVEIVEHLDAILALDADAYLREVTRALNRVSRMFNPVTETSCSLVTAKR